MIIQIFWTALGCTGHWGLQKRKLIQLKKKHLKKNGGTTLLHLLSQHERQMNAFKIFTAEELSKATHNYDGSRVLGQGGQGTVYMGGLPDNTIVAIQVQQFMNEIRINHKNVVNLLGCCLETQVPMDNKTTNILLDIDYTAKVSDFGTAKFAPVDRTSMTTLVQGTLGYILCCVPWLFSATLQGLLASPIVN
ncbi:hypothetical protein V2J09_023507 [Rumex salicifolius]